MQLDGDGMGGVEVGRDSWKPVGEAAHARGTVLEISRCMKWDNVDQ